MTTLQAGRPAARTVADWRATRPAGALAAIVLGMFLTAGGQLWAEKPLSPQPNPYQATSSRAARRNALQSIPFDQLDTEARAKVASVLRKVSVFRRMPIRVIDCDPDLYLFLVRHPDVVVNIWEVMNVSQLQIRQTGAHKYRVAEPEGTLANVEFLYRGHDTHVIYAEGRYEGPLFSRPVGGRTLTVLKSGYVRETDGRYYITNRLDTFVQVERGGAELLTKAFHPLVGKVADNNYIQTVAFLGSLSRTAEVNYRGVQRLASKLQHVQPQARLRLAELAAEVARKSTLWSLGRTSSPPLAVSLGKGLPVQSSAE